MRFAPRPADPQRSVATLRSRDDDRQRHTAKPALAASAPQALSAAVRPDAALWSQIGRLAAAIAAREPVLGRLATVPFDAAPARIVSAALCHPLAGGDRTRSAAMADLLVETMDEDPAVLEFLEADLKAVVRRDPACRSALHALIHFKGFQALQAHRVAHSLWRRGRCDLAHWLSSQSSLILGVDIHPAVPIGKGVVLDHGSGVVIGETALVEDGVTILHGVTLGSTGKQRGDRHPKVRYGAFLGAGATVLGNIEIGRMSKIGAGSVVVRPVPAWSTVAGVAASVVRTGSANVLQRAGACGRAA